MIVNNRTKQTTEEPVAYKALFQEKMNRNQWRSTRIVYKYKLDTSIEHCTYIWEIIIKS
jgi:hypothetical protein